MDTRPAWSALASVCGDSIQHTGQVSFLRMTTAADVPYGTGALKSKYHGQDGPTPSQYWKNFEQ